MFGPKKPTTVMDRSHLREQQKQTAALKEQNRLIKQQNNMMRRQGGGAGEGKGSLGGGLLGDVGKALGAVGGAIAETVSELQEDYRSHRTQLSEAHKQQHARSQLGNHASQTDAPDETNYIPPTGPTNPLTHSSVWSQLAIPGAPKVQLDGYFHATAPEDLNDYLTALGQESKYPFTATMLAINLLPGEQGATLLAAFARTLATHPTLYGAIGYGPRQLVENLDELDTHLTNLINTEAKILAIGPIGLDAVYAPHTLPQQIEQLKLQLAIAADFELPVYLMNREATAQLEEVIASLPVKPPAIIYTKPLRTSEEIAMVKHMDAHILLRAEFTWPEENIYRAAVLHEVPRARWLLASGNGLTAAHSRKGQTNSPESLREVIAATSALTNLPKDDLLTQLNTNAHRLFLR